MDKTQYIVKVSDKDTNVILAIELITAQTEKGIFKKLKGKYKNFTLDIREVGESGEATIKI